MLEEPPAEKAPIRKTPIKSAQLAEQLLGLGVEPGDVLLVHTSFRAVGPIEGGPEGLINALVQTVGPNGTLVMPSWPDDACVQFDPTSTPAATDLGVVAQHFWQRPGVIRTTHVHAFSALGPKAQFILSGPLPIPPHIPASPVGRVHEVDGKVLLLGVNHDADTTIHLAEVIAGVRYGRPKSCVATVEGRPVRIEYLENDHCCDRFKLVDDWLREAGAQSEGVVGYAPSRLARATDIVSLVSGRLAQTPLLFLHDPSSGCRQCNEARANIPS